MLVNLVFYFIYIISVTVTQQQVMIFVRNVSTSSDI